MKIFKINTIIFICCSMVIALPSSAIVTTKTPISKSASVPTRVCPCSTCPSGICPVCPFTCSTSQGCGTPIPCTTATVPFCCLNISNNATILGTLVVPCETITGNLTVGGNLFVGDTLLVEGRSNFIGSVVIGGNLQLDGNATISGNELLQGSLEVDSGATFNAPTSGVPLTVNGDEQVNGNLTTTGNETINHNLLVGGNTLLESTLTVNGNADFKQDVFINDSLDVARNVTVDGNTTIAGSIIVNGGAIFNIIVTINGNEILNGPLSVTGNSIINGNLTVDGSTTLIGPVAATNGMDVSQGVTINSGGLTVDAGGANITGDLTVSAAENVPNMQVSGTLTVADNSNFNNVFVSGTLTTNDTATFGGGLQINAGGETITSGSLNMPVGNLSISGTSTLTGQITTTNGFIVNGSFFVDGGEQVSQGPLFVTTNALLTGNLSVAGPITSTGAVTLPSLTLTNTTNSTSDATGTLIVDGGVGIGRDLWLGGSEFLPTVNGTPSPLNYYEEACYATAFIWGGLTVQPPASVYIQVIRVGNIVNLLIPPLYINNPGAHSDVVTATVPLPPRFRPFSTVRGASSTILSNNPANLALNPAMPAVMGTLGEYNVDPSGIITFGFSGPNLAPQRISSIDFVQVDANTITYNINSCAC